MSFFEDAPVERSSTGLLTSAPPEVWTCLAKFSTCSCAAGLRRLTSGCCFWAPEVSGFTSGRLRVLAEAPRLASGGFPEVVSAVICGDFSVVLNF